MTSEEPKIKISKKEIRLVEAVRNDFNDFVTLRKSLMKPTTINQGLPWDEEAENIYHEKLFASDGLLKIIVGEDRIGYIGVAETEAGVVEISRFCIATEYQGTGIGTYILDNRIFSVPEFQEKDFVLEVLRTNPARKLYESLGFTPIDEDDKIVYYKKEA